MVIETTFLNLLHLPVGTTEGFKNHPPWLFLIFHDQVVQPLKIFPLYSRLLIKVILSIILIRVDPIFEHVNSLLALTFQFTQVRIREVI